MQIILQLTYSATITSVSSLIISVHMGSFLGQPVPWRVKRLKIRCVVISFFCHNTALCIQARVVESCMEIFPRETPRVREQSVPDTRGKGNWFKGKPAEKASTPSQRAFSLAGLTMEERRTQLYDTSTEVSQSCVRRSCVWPPFFSSRPIALCLTEKLEFTFKNYRRLTFYLLFDKD